MKFAENTKTTILTTMVSPSRRLYNDIVRKALNLQLIGFSEKTLPNGILKIEVEKEFEDEAAGIVRSISLTQPEYQSIAKYGYHGGCMKTAKCVLDMNDWMSSLESARLTVTSPSGKTMEIKKSRVFCNKKLTEIEKRFIHKLGQLSGGEFEFKHFEMQLILEISNK